MEIGSHTLNINEEEYPEKFLPILNRLKEALNNPEIRRQMHEEDEFLRHLQNMKCEEGQEDSVVFNKNQTK